MRAKKKRNKELMVSPNNRTRALYREPDNAN